MNRKYFILFMFLFTVLFAGCSQDGEKTLDDRAEDGQCYIYYLDNNETQLVREDFYPEEISVEGQIKEYTRALKEKKPSKVMYKKALPDYVEMTADKAVENQQLTVNFDSSYLNLTGASEVLCRAAIVKTLCQIDGVDYVQFLIDGQPLKNSYDAPVGFMKAEDFIDNTGGETKYEQNAVVILYFADSEGKRLVDTRVKIKYDGTIPLEELVLSQLIKGPECIEGVKEGEILPTISKNAGLNKVTIKEGICYVDFNKEFSLEYEGVSKEVVLYSIVNSLVEIPEVNKVRITIEGGPVTNSGLDIDLNGPVERDLDIVSKTD